MSSLRKKRFRSDDGGRCPRSERRMGKIIGRDRVRVGQSRRQQTPRRQDDRPPVKRGGGLQMEAAAQALATGTSVVMSAMAGIGRTRDRRPLAIFRRRPHRGGLVPVGRWGLLDEATQHQRRQHGPSHEGSRQRQGGQAIPYRSPFALLGSVLVGECHGWMASLSVSASACRACRYGGPSFPRLSQRSPWSARSRPFRRSGSRESCRPRPRDGPTPSA